MMPVEAFCSPTLAIHPPQITDKPIIAERNGPGSGPLFGMRRAYTHISKKEF
jgi:hypothetical protein